MTSFAIEFGLERGKALCDLMLVEQGFVPTHDSEDLSILADVSATYEALAAAGNAPLTDEERSRVAMTLRRVVDGAGADHATAIANARAALT